MKRHREKLLVLMEILSALREGPLVPNRLSQACNLNYQRMMTMLVDLERKGLIAHDAQQGHDLYSLTPEGLKVSMNYQWINAMAIGDASSGRPTPKRSATGRA